MIKAFNGITFSDISDHLPIVHICNMDNNKECEKQTTNEPDYTRIFNKKNINSFTDEIKNVSWSNVLTNANPEIAFNEFSDSFRKIYETNFPLTKKSSKINIIKIESLWMTNCMLNSIKRKNKLYKTHLTKPCKKNEIKYKRYKNKLSHTIKISKKMYYEEQLIKYKRSTKMVWKTIN